MKVYLAGNISLERERVLIEHSTNRLFTFYYHGKNKEFNKEFTYRLDQIKRIKNVLPLT